MTDLLEPSMEGDDSVVRESVLVLAPHLRYPTTNGGDIAADRIARHLSMRTERVDLLAESELVQYVGGDVRSRHPHPNRMRSRLSAAGRTLWRRSNYLLEKFVTPSYAEMARSLMTKSEHGTIIASFICTATLIPPAIPAKRILILTHNDQVKWFTNMENAVGNPVSRQVARLSRRWYSKFYAEAPVHYRYVYFTEADCAGHVSHFGDHHSMVVPIGTDLPMMNDRARPKTSPEAPIVLTFIGSLGVRMNYDALAHLAVHFLPTLRSRLGEKCVVRVVGSTPSTEVANLCRREGWQLEADVTDERLSAIYAETTFTVLPFPYATGAKLKLLSSLAHGVPFLATELVSGQQPLEVWPCLLSNDPDAWLDRIQAMQEEGLTEAQRQALREAAVPYSWQASVDRLVHLCTSAVASEAALP